MQWQYSYVEVGTLEVASLLHLYVEVDIIENDYSYVEVIFKGSANVPMLRSVS